MTIVCGDLDKKYAGSLQREKDITSFFIISDR